MVAASIHALFDPARHEPLTTTPWDEGLARRAIERIAASAESEYDASDGSWRTHPLDDPETPDARLYHLYSGAAGAIWALHRLADVGAIALHTDFSSVVAQLPRRTADAVAAEMHGSASYFLGSSGAQLLHWKSTRSIETADALFDTVRSNLRNSAKEALWGNPGTLIAATHMAESTTDPRWPGLVREGVDILLEEMEVDPETGTWVWEQDLYGRKMRMLGAGHGLVGNAFPAFRASHLLDPGVVSTLQERTLRTLQATAVRAEDCLNWHHLIDAERVAGRSPLVHDCHGAPGVVCRLSHAPGSDEWTSLLCGAGELVWRAGPLATKGASLCHGTPGSAMACLKLWRRSGEERWLARARALAVHSLELVERHRAHYGVGRHSLWTGDLGVACLLWNCITADDDYPLLDSF